MFFINWWVKIMGSTWKTYTTTAFNGTFIMPSQYIYDKGLRRNHPEQGTQAGRVWVFEKVCPD
jgi:hypothetical protein